MRYKRTNVLQLTNSVQQNVKKKQLFHSYNNLLIMFSGGQDSAFCMLVFHLLQNKIRLELNSTRSAARSGPGILSQTQYSKRKLDLLQKQSNTYLQKASFYRGPPRPASKAWVRTQTFLSLQKDTKAEQSGPGGPRVRITPYSSKYKNIEKKSIKNSTFTETDFDLLDRQKNKSKYIYLFLTLSSYTPLLLSSQTKNTKDFVFCKRFQTDVYTNSYTLLWCNHLWQKDSFFTMEHVSKLSFSLCCTTAFFIPIKNVFSEESARNWRHKIMQRFAFFTSQRKYSYKYQAFKQTFLSQKQLYPNDYPSKTLTQTKFGYVQACIAQGHSKSDRAEAILFNLIRGAGIDGISTLQWKRTFFYNSSYKFYPTASDLY